MLLIVAATVFVATKSLVPSLAEVTICFSVSTVCAATLISAALWGAAVVSVLLVPAVEAPAHAIAGNTEIPHSRARYVFMLSGIVVVSRCW